MQRRRCPRTTCSLAGCSHAALTRPGSAPPFPPCCPRTKRRFATPLAVLVGWATGHPFTLSFDPFSALVLLLAVCQLNFVTSGAMSHW